MTIALMFIHSESDFYNGKSVGSWLWNICSLKELWYEGTVWADSAIYFL